MCKDRLHILLVEDNPNDADLLQETLAQVDQKLEIKHVERLQQALEYIKQGVQVDVILLDLGLPDSMGIATLERANSAAPQLPIIVLTGLEDEDVGIEAVRKGAQDYLVKGQTKPRMILRSIHHAIERKRMEEALRLESAKLQTVLDAAPVAIWIAHDPECRRITGNAYADEIIMNIPRGGNISRSAEPGEAAVTYKVVRNGREMRPEELPAQLAAGTGRPVIDQDLDLVFPDGRTVHLLMGALPLFDAHGRVCGSVSAGSDVTLMRQTEEALLATNEELASFNQAMVGRELRMIELKKEINALSTQLGRSPPYPLEFEKE
jgi:CheY-like chemotaxis protein